MMLVDEIIATLRLNTNALGVWLLGPMVIANNQYQNDVLAAAVENSSIKPPLNAVVTSETQLDFEDRGIYAMPIGPAILVVVFDEQSSMGLIRLRVRHVMKAIEAALAART